MSEKMTNQEKQLIADYINSQSKKVVSHIDVLKNEIEYDSSIATGREIKSKNCGDEEYVRAFILTRLVNELGYKPSNIILEAARGMGRVPDNKIVYVDIRVADSAGNAYLFFEIKSPSEFDDEMDNAIKNQLFAVSNHEADTGHKAKYLIYYTVNFTQTSVADNAIIIDKDTCPTFDEWEEERNFLNEIPAHYGKALKKPYIKGSDKDLIDNYTQESINTLSVKLHNVLWGGGSSSDNDIFTSLTNIILAKIEDEDNTGDGEVYKFQSMAFDEGEEEFETNETLYERINQLYKEALKDRLNVTDTKILTESNVIDKNKFSLNKLKYTVQALEKFSFRSQDGAIMNKDILGDFFEGIIRNDYKQSKGQFFTPLNIVKFMFYAVQADTLAISMINNKKSLPFMIDSSAGSGTFLIEYMKNITSSVKANIDKLRTTPQIRSKVLEWFPDYAENRWAQTFIYGTELNFDLGTAVKVNMILHGDGSANVFTGTQYGDGLLEFNKYVKKSSDGTNRDNNELEKENDSSVYPRKVNEHFDIIMTNPPFSVDLDNETKKTLATSFIFDTKKNSENLFIERYYQLLKPNGRLAVVLPESVFDTTENKYIRLFIYKYFKIKAIVSLPQTTFAFTNTKTSILFAQKKTDEEVEEWNDKWNELVSEYGRLKTKIENIQAVYLHFKDINKYPSIKKLSESEMKDLVIETLDGVIAEKDKELNLVDILNKYDYELNDSKCGILRVDKDTIDIAGYCNSFWVLRRITKELDQDIFMAEVEHVGYKNTKRKGKVILKPDVNELFNMSGNDIVLDDDSLLSEIRNISWDE